MKSFLLSFMLLFSVSAHAGWGSELPLLMEIVANTLHTMQELEKQSRQMQDELDGIRDKIERVRTIAELVQPSEWEKWKDPVEALNRTRTIYKTLPPEYRSEKYDQLEGEVTRAMNMIARLSSEAKTTFESGKELERRAATASPGVSQKLTASGIGTLISLQSQSQVLQSQMTSLLAQMMAEMNEKESRSVISKGSAFQSLALGISQKEKSFSSVVYRKERSE